MKGQSSKCSIYMCVCAAREMCMEASEAMKKGV